MLHCLLLFDIRTWPYHNFAASHGCQHGCDCRVNICVNTCNKVSVAKEYTETKMAGLTKTPDETGLCAGEIWPRSEIQRLGKRHHAVRLYLFSARNELLLQRRGLGVDHAPDVFSISVGGHVGEVCPFSRVPAMVADETGVMAQVYGRACRGLVYFLENGFR